MSERLGKPLDAPLFDRVALIGLGLIGSSIARAVRHRNVARTIVAIDRDEATIARVRELGIADDVTTDAAEGVHDADLVILCVPVGACEAVAKVIGKTLKAGAIVSDVGSVKASVIAQVQPHLPDGRVIRAGASGRGHRIFRTRCGLCDAVSQPLVHSHAPGGHGRRRRSTACRRSGRRWARTWR